MQSCERPIKGYLDCPLLIYIRQSIACLCHTFCIIQKERAFCLNYAQKDHCFQERLVYNPFLCNFVYRNEPFDILLFLHTSGNHLSYPSIIMVMRFNIVSQIYSSKGADLTLSDLITLFHFELAFFISQELYYYLSSF